MAYALRILTGGLQGELIALTEGRAITLGRDTTNDLKLPDRKLSRIHCQLEVSGGRCRVTDLNSTNGTFVNERRIQAATEVKPGDMIELGLTRGEIVDVAEGAARAAPAHDTAADASTLEQTKCEECGKVVPGADIAGGRAKRVGDRCYCAECCGLGPVSEQESPMMEQPTEDTAERCKPGKELAGVRIISVVGEGRVGPLYKGEQVSMGRLVSLKVLTVSDEEWARKYLKAVYASGQLVHGNIALIFDTGEENGLNYVIREYVEGHSAQERLSARQPLAPLDAYGIITQAAYAIEHAYERHLTHGWLSPAKILIGPRGQVKVTGFGLPLAPPPGANATAYIWHHLSYMPPERVKGEGGSDFIGDVYSLTAVFYHLLTGRPPFVGSSRESIERRILTKTPRPISDFVTAPQMAQKIMDRGLSKDLRSRYQTPRELLYDLEEKLRREL